MEGAHSKHIHDPAMRLTSIGGSFCQLAHRQARLPETSLWDIARHTMGIRRVERHYHRPFDYAGRFLPRSNPQSAKSCQMQNGPRERRWKVQFPEVLINQSSQPVLILGAALCNFRRMKYMLIHADTSTLVT
ncbi:uncharacterized protein TNCV_5098731 [Trichonephila clavipes]|uniref:Uncharacterized protein n=1 Tax=Trichonephila clavipes TaxID=2585209 RepID=A0A8X6RUF7_TRICX|nr:uncharacterized protein TNCV_5098731 [Trichonephila clavipes]